MDIPCRARWASALLIGILAALMMIAGCGSSAPQAQVKARRFNDSTPLDGAKYAAQPINVTLNFSVDVKTQGSTLSVKSSDGREWASGPVIVEDQNTAMKRELREGMPDGEYAVGYTVAYASGAPSKGNFSFSIDKKLQSEYRDLRGQKSVQVKMVGLKFVPQDMIVSPGTTITWVNEESHPHFVNTETHPEHTYYPPMNSTELQIGATFSVMLERQGQYDYHCSLHYPQRMVGSVIVSD